MEPKPMNSHHQPTVLKFVMNRLNEHNTVHLDSHLHIIQTINFWFSSLLASMQWFISFDPLRHWGTLGVLRNFFFARPPLENKRLIFGWNFDKQLSRHGLHSIWRAVVEKDSILRTMSWWQLVVSGWCICLLNVNVSENVVFYCSTESLYSSLKISPPCVASLSRGDCLFSDGYGSALWKHSNL